MKVIRSGPPVTVLSKEDTKVGEVYTYANLGSKVYFRTQGGFAVLTTGEFIYFADASQNGWIHEPKALLDLNSQHA